MRTLADLSSQLRLGLVPMLRTDGQALVVPSVIHWRQNHYGAIVSRHGDVYKVVDPTFGRHRYITAETINAEASGNFLVPFDRVPANYRLLSSDEMDTVRGRGNPNFLGDGDDQEYSCEDGEGPSGLNGPNGGPGSGELGPRRGCSDCFGMPVWSVSEPYINLSLRDVPLGYQPARGSEVSFKLSYRQRNETIQNWGFPSVGQGWNCSWLSHVDAAWYNRYYIPDFGIYYAQGGVAGYDLSAGMGHNYYNNRKLTAVTNSGVLARFELLYPNGAKDVYAYAPTNLGGVADFYFLSQKIDPNGATTTLYYHDYDPEIGDVILTYVLDADGRTNTISYATSGWTNLIVQVTDPFGRSTSLAHDENNLLTNLTDVAGLSGSIRYDELGWVTNLTTAYGTTTFLHTDKSVSVGPYELDRSVTITEPNNSKQLYAFLLGNPYQPWTYPAAEVPTNTPLDTLDNSIEGRLSFHWGRLQYPLLSTNVVDYFTTNDFAVGRLRHWLGVTVDDQAKSVDTLAIEREPSPGGGVEGQKTWYDHVNKDPYWQGGQQGDHILPNVLARVLPDGSTWYIWKQRNEWGSPTNVVETYTKPDGSIGLRTNTFTYSGLDLVLHRGVQGEQVVSNYFGNAYHQPDASYDSLSQATLYNYNGNRQLIRVQRPSGLTTTNIYFTTGDAANRLQKTIDLEINRTNTYTYYANGLILSHSDERGLTTTNYWDNLQRLTGTKHPDGTTTSNRYTALDLTANKDRLGYWSYASYNGIRQKTAETNANGVITRYGLCECGAVMSITNAWNTAVQMVTSFGYDNQGNRTYVYLPDATVTNWYDSLQRLITTCDGWGCRSFYFNHQGLLTNTSNIYGSEQTTVFDIEDRPIYVTDANGVTITNTYDDLSRLRTRAQPDGGVEKFGYSARGLVAYTNQLDKITYYGYDEAARKTWETNANNEITRYTNNAAGDLLSLTDGKNQTTKWNYDEYGRVTNKLDQVALEILRYKYDPDSRLTNRWSAAKTNTYYSYDPVGNLTNINYPVSTDVKFQYDALNRLTNMIDASGTNKYTFASGGQLLTEDGPFASDTVTNSYSNRLRTGLSLQQATGVWTNGFGYDAAKRLTNVTSQAGSFAYTFPSGIQHLVSRIALPNGSYITNTYDNVARLTGTWLKNSTNGTLNSHQYTYNPGNQRTQQVFNVGSTYNYTYDAIGQLTFGDSATASEDRRYVYDAAWNLNYRTNNTTLNTFKVDGKNQLTNATPVGTQTYDSNGNVTWSAGTANAYRYDDENQLANWYYYDGGFDLNGETSESKDKRTQFIYDGKGLLRKRVEYSSDGSNWQVDSETRYLYDGRRVIQERNSANTPTVSYTRGNDLSGSLEGAGGIGGLLARSHGYASSNGNWYAHNCYHADGNGNITYLVNSSQTLAASYRYDPYGNTISSSGSLASANVYRFSSKEIHVNSGLYYYGYRWYAPNLQRWLNRDPIGDVGFARLIGTSARTETYSPNAYMPFVNAPLTHADPDGRHPIILIGGGIIYTLGCGIIINIQVTRYKDQLGNCDCVTFVLPKCLNVLVPITGMPGTLAMTICKDGKGKVNKREFIILNSGGVYGGPPPGA